MFTPSTEVPVVSGFDLRTVILPDRVAVDAADEQTLLTRATLMVTIRNVDEKGGPRAKTE